MKLFISSVAVAYLSFASLASAYNKEAGNGGDICEDRIKSVGEDIASWIKAGGSQGLALPKGVSVSQYNDKMLKEIASAEISCVDSKIVVNGVEKTCKNFGADEGVPQIVCNSTRFMETSDSDQYVLVHHEYAGLAGFEVNTGATSSYLISNQLSEYLVDETVKKLAIKKTPPISNSGPTSYQQLKAAFDSAGPARIDDFPELADMMGENPPFKCVSADVDGLLNDHEIVGRVERTIPSNGPLFPPGSESLISPMNISASGYWDLFNELVFVSGAETLKTTVNSSGDLQSVYIQSDKKQCPDVVSTYIYRKKGKLLFIRGTGQIRDGEMCAGYFLNLYGYCFPSSM